MHAQPSTAMQLLARVRAEVAAAAAAAAAASPELAPQAAAEGLSTAMQLLRRVQAEVSALQNGGAERAGEEAAREENEAAREEEEAASEEEEEGDDDGRPPFSCWTSRGNWTLHGIDWLKTCPGHYGMPIEERVRICLVANPWCWDIDFSDARAASPTWFHITPTTLTPTIAAILASHVTHAARSDWEGLRGTARQRAFGSQRKRLQESEQSREPLVWVEHLVYLWNVSRGHCADPHCAENNAPLEFKAAVTECADGKADWSAVEKTFSMQRLYNNYFHQWWNVSSLVHKHCNSVTNSHIACGHDVARQRHNAESRYTLPAGVALGGPSGYFTDFHGGDTRPLPEIHPANGKNANMRYISNWLTQQGITHAPHCTGRGGRRSQPGACRHDDCPFGNARADLITQLGGVQILGSNPAHWKKR